MRRVVVLVVFAVALVSACTSPGGSGAPLPSLAPSVQADPRQDY